jgi:enterobactin synthetase component F
VSLAQVEAERSWLPLTLPQLDFWEEFVLHPELPLSTVAHCLELEGDVDQGALVRAIRETVREAEVLSICFREGADGPLQRCDPERTPLVQTFDLRRSAEPAAEAARWMERDLGQPCDLRRDKLSAQVLFRIGERRYLWYVRAHHIIVDGYALALLERRCGQLYGALRGASEAGVPFHPFSSFLEEEEAYRASERWQADRSYWTEYLAAAHALPVLDKGGEDYGLSGRHHQEALSPALSLHLQATASALEIGWPDLLVLLSGAYVHELSAGARLRTLWLPFMSRWGSVGAYVPAMTVNILPFHLTIVPGESLPAFLRRSAAALRKLRLHGRYRIEQIAADHGLGKGQRFFFSPLINVLPFTAPNFVGCRVKRDILASGVGDGLNLTFRGAEDGADLSLHIEADASIGADAFARLCELPAFLDRALVQARREEAVWRAR